MKIEEPSIPKGRVSLAAVIRHAKDVIRIDDVESALYVQRQDAAKLLSRWTSQGWLRRVGRGTYVAAELGTLDFPYVLEDPWILVPALFAPAYIGGWSATEHCGLTDQIFRDILVMTARTVREKRKVCHGACFILRHIKVQKIFGTETVWCGQSQVLVSDVHRTMVDILDSPSVGGGFLHVAECLGNYLRHPERSDDTLINYALKFGNGAVFKRLGFLAEDLPASDVLIDTCRKHLTNGTAKLDPLLKCPRLISRWRLWVPSYMAPGVASD